MPYLFNHICPRCRKPFFKNKQRFIYCSQPCADQEYYRASAQTLLESLLSKVVKTPKCWIFTGVKSIPGGYGRIRVPGSREDLAHRVSWQLMYGEIPNDLWVLHNCDNPPCVRPSHLFLGSPLDNKQDSVNKNRHVYGERVNTAKLTERQVIAIYEACLRGERKSFLAVKHDVAFSTICRIAKKEMWKHLFETL